MIKFYLNGQISDKYRNALTGNDSMTRLLNGNVRSYKNKEYFSRYESRIRACLAKTHHALFSMKTYKVYNPFAYHTYAHCTGLKDWNWIDFVKFDIKELLDNYNYMILLPNWWQCREARVNYLIAKILGIRILSYKKLVKELL